MPSFSYGAPAGRVNTTKQKKAKSVSAHQRASPKIAKRIAVPQTVAQESNRKADPWSSFDKKQAGRGGFMSRPKRGMRAKKAMSKMGM